MLSNKTLIYFFMAVNFVVLCPESLKAKICWGEDSQEEECPPSMPSPLPLQDLTNSNGEDQEDE